LNIASSVKEIMSSKAQNENGDSQKLVTLTKTLIDFASYFDPTGILGMVNLFVRDTCPV